jgi:hypothetical protein
VHDDLDDTIIENTSSASLSFGLDGKLYDIDLTPENQAVLRDLLAPYIQAATIHNSKAKPAKGSANDLKAVRAWAVANGLPNSGRGRIPVAVHAAYVEAHK